MEQLPFLISGMVTRRPNFLPHGPNPTSFEGEPVTCAKKNARAKAKAAKAEGQFLGGQREREDDFYVCQVRSENPGTAARDTKASQPAESSCSNCCVALLWIYKVFSSSVRELVGLLFGRKRKRERAREGEKERRREGEKERQRGRERERDREKQTSVFRQTDRQTDREGERERGSGGEKESGRDKGRGRGRGETGEKERDKRETEDRERQRDKHGERKRERDRDIKRESRQISF